MMSFHVGLDWKLTISLESVDILHYVVEVTQRKSSSIAVAEAKELSACRVNR